MFQHDRHRKQPRRFSHPTVFWLGVAAGIPGVGLTLPVDAHDSSMGSRPAGVPAVLVALCAVVAIATGLALSLSGLTALAVLVSVAALGGPASWMLVTG